MTQNIDWLIVEPTGVDDTANIKAAISTLSATGGEIRLRANTYIISSSIELKNGVNFVGIYPGPVFDGYTPNFCAGATMALDGATGTVLKANTTGITCFTNNVQDIEDPELGEKPISVNMNSLGFLDFETVVHSGGKNQYGFGYCRWENIRIDGSTGFAYKLWNFQGLHLTSVYGADCIKAYHLVQEHETCQHGNSVWVDVFFDCPGSEIDEAVLIESLWTDSVIGNKFNFMTFLRPQVNQFGGSIPSNESNAIWRMRGESTEDYENSSGVTALSVSTATDAFTLAGHKVTNGCRLVFTEVTTLPTGITAGTVYYAVSVTADTFKVSATRDGSAIDLTGSPTNDNTVTNPGISTIFKFNILHPDLEGNCHRSVDMTKCLNCQMTPDKTPEDSQQGTHTYTMRNCLYSRFDNVIANQVYDADDNRFQVWGAAGDFIDEWPLSGLLWDITGNYQRIACGNDNEMLFRHTNPAFTPNPAHTTWPSLAHAPTYYPARTTSLALGKTRMGVVRYSGMAAGVTHTNPLSQQVALGCAAYIFNDDATYNVTVATSGSDTINGAIQTLTVAPGQVAIMTSDNQGSNTNWIGFVVAVVDS